MFFITHARVICTQIKIVIVADSEVMYLIRIFIQYLWNIVED